MLKFRYLLIVFFINFFLKSTYSQACSENASTTRNCTGPLNVTVSGQTITNSFEISLTGGPVPPDDFTGYKGIFSTGSGNIITNLNAINVAVTSLAYSYALQYSSGSDNEGINSGTITATSVDNHGLGLVNASQALSFGASRNGSSNLKFTNSGTIRATSINSRGMAVLNENTLTFTNTNTGILIGESTGTNPGHDGVGIYDRFGDSTFINSGTITGTSANVARFGYGIQLASTVQNSTITNSGTITGSTAGIINLGTGITITNSGTITGGTNSINNSGVINLTLNQGSKLIGTITNSGTLNITSNVGASKSYAYSGTVTSLTDSNNRPSALGSAVAINIGSMEVSGENLYQKTANITDAIDRNVKNNKDTWVEPYYSESTRDSGGDSSQIRQFKNNKQGVNAGFKAENSATLLQVIFNLDQTKNNIDSSEHIINSDGVMIGLISPKYTQYEGFDVSVKGLVGYANSKTDRKILDNTSSTGERTLTGEYDSYYAVVGSALSKNYNLDKDLNANLTLGADLTSEFRDSYSENLYFKYNSLDLVQLQPRIQSEFIKTTGKDSNLFLTAGVGAREVLSGKTQKYSMNNIGVSFTTPNSGDYYASLAAGTNMNVAANVNFYTLVRAKMSEKDTENYQASLGLKGTF
jgi:hypothetical protein